MPMVVVEMHCSYGAYDQIVTSDFALPIRHASFGAITRVRFEGHAWRPGELYWPWVGGPLPLGLTSPINCSNTAADTVTPLRMAAVPAGR